ncbi:alpha/beta hydrolase [Corynebacterium sp. UMB2355A]|uniref:alpha/beta hydrolase n=1 Tax=Corynebacterium sp. UMB2355A TaxID=3081222 RepID=UPI0029FEE63D|nr:alpha/beta hydrolase [Corynebacterium sp. UMB2355A]WPJ91994.1 alpha/beta hydrolase [Corynebacterium sp. UMB2355A]
MVEESSLQPGAEGAHYPLNEQGSEEFQVGGVERTLPESEQLAQLVSYIEASYEDSPQYLALLPDRITHAAMLMLGSAVDHQMPGVALTGDVSVEDAPLGQVFTSSKAPAKGGVWVVSCYDGPADAREFAWRPEVAACAEQAGARAYDVDDPAGVASAVHAARQEGADVVAVWGTGSSCGLLPAGADAYVLTFPAESTEAAGALATADAKVLLQRASDAAWEQPSVEGAEVKEYVSTGVIATPAQHRRKVLDAAEFLSGLAVAEG